MNLFKFGRGDFFGIIIPGAFLLANFVYFFMPEILEEKNNTALYSMILILSYIIGISLRPLSPEWFECFPPQFKKDWGKFPYINWYLDTHLNSLPNSYGMFSKSLLDNEFGDDRTRIDQEGGKDFINYCKSVVCMKSDALHEGILHAEGLSRLISGMGYALAICVLFASVKCLGYLFTQPALVPWTYIYLILAYLMMCLFFKGNLRRARGKEATTVLDAFVIVEMEAELTKVSNNCIKTSTKSVV